VTKPIFDDWYPREEYLPSALTKRRQAMRYAGTDSMKHVNTMLEEWFKVHDRVGLWLQLTPVAVELGREMLAADD